MKLFRYIFDNGKKANNDKCHVLITTNKNSAIKKTGHKINALSRILSYMNFEKTLILRILTAP